MALRMKMTSAAANNGSGFEGLKDDTTFWNISTGIMYAFSLYTNYFAINDCIKFSE